MDPCCADGVAWEGERGTSVPLSTRACLEPAEGAPTPLLVEDALRSDERLPTTEEGVPAAPLCRYHGLQYRGARHIRKCSTGGCWRLGTGALPGGYPACAEHGERGHEVRA